MCGKSDFYILFPSNLDFLILELHRHSLA